MRALDLLIFGGDDCCKIPIALIQPAGRGFECNGLFALATESRAALCRCLLLEIALGRL